MSIESEVKAVENKVAASPTTEEKLLVKSIEAEFLNVQLEFNNVKQRGEALEKKYRETVEALAKKYSVDLAVHGWNAVKAEFVKVVKSL